jgi:hypothetical protein
MNLPSLHKPIIKVSENKPIIKFIGGIQRPNNWIRESKGVVDTSLVRGTYFRGADRAVTDNIIRHEQDYFTIMKAYKMIPMVFGAINTKADFAVQEGFELQGDKGDVDRLMEWMATIRFDNFRVQVAKEMMLFGDVYVVPEGEGDTLKLKFMPVDSMYIIRDKFGQHLGYAQIVNYTVGDTWKPEEMIHFSWNTIGTDAYGLSEIVPIWNVLGDKLDVENVLSLIAKFHSEPIKMFKLGRPEQPYNEDMINAWVASLENRTVGGDIVCKGDVDVVPIQPNQSSADVISLIDHIDNQALLGLRFPDTLIVGKSDVQASLTKMDALERNIKSLQDSMAVVMEGQIFTRVIGKTKVPHIVDNPLNIETRLRTSRTLRQFVGDGKAPPIMLPKEAREELGLPPVDDEELKKWMPQVPEPIGGNNDTGKKPTPFGK